MHLSVLKISYLMLELHECFVPLSSCLASIWECSNSCYPWSLRVVFFLIWQFIVICFLTYSFLSGVFIVCIIICYVQRLYIKVWFCWTTESLILHCCMESSAQRTKHFFATQPILVFTSYLWSWNPVSSVHTQWQDFGLPEF